MDNSVTLAGTLLHEPLQKKVGEDAGASSCRFTLGIERTWKDRRSGEDKVFSTYHEVVCYRTLATNVLESCQKGDSVLVVGRLNTRKVGAGEATITEVIADHVALNLSSGSIPFD